MQEMRFAIKMASLSLTQCLLVVVSISILMFRTRNVYCDEETNRINITKPIINSNQQAEMESITMQTLDLSNSTSSGDETTLSAEDEAEAERQKQAMAKAAVENFKKSFNAYQQAFDKSNKDNDFSTDEDFESGPKSKKYKMPKMKGMKFG